MRVESGRPESRPAPGRLPATIPDELPESFVRADRRIDRIAPREASNPVARQDSASAHQSLNGESPKTVKHHRIHDQSLELIEKCGHVCIGDRLIGEPHRAQSRSAGPGFGGRPGQDTKVRGVDGRTDDDLLGVNSNQARNDRLVPRGQKLDRRTDAVEPFHRPGDQGTAGAGHLVHRRIHDDAAGIPVCAWVYVPFAFHGESPKTLQQRRPLVYPLHFPRFTRAAFGPQVSENNGVVVLQIRVIPGERAVD